MNSPYRAESLESNAMFLTSPMDLDQEDEDEWI